MKVAIPHWQGRVSPVFDVAGQILIVEIEGGVELARHEWRLDEEFVQARGAWLARSGVDVLICGAISRALEVVVSQAGIDVISQICGDVEGILAAFIRGQLDEESFRMPGCGGGGRRRRGRRGCPDNPRRRGVHVKRKYVEEPRIGDME